MKKRLEAELISLAHRVLKLKNKSEIDQLYLESRKLYETLAVLKFYGDNYEQVKSDISKEDLDEKLSAIQEEKAPEVLKLDPLEKIVVTDEPIIEPAIEEEIVVVHEMELEEDEDEIEEEIAEEDVEFEGEIANLEEEGLPMPEMEKGINFEPIFELEEEPTILEEEKTEVKKQESKQISFEDLLGGDYNEPVFVKPNDVVIPPSLISVLDEKPMSLNDQHSKAINIGMNDRIAFVKHLFADSDEDYNRVLSQLNTFSSQEEALDFIEEIIKPDYNNWKGSEEYAERFMEIVENKFN